MHANPLDGAVGRFALSVQSGRTRKGPVAGMAVAQVEQAVVRCQL